MKFLQQVKSSIYDPQFYRKGTVKSLGKAVGYYFLLCLCLTILHTALLVPSLLKNITWLTTTGVQQVINTFPGELQVSVHNGLVTTNVSQPYVIPLSSPTTDTMKNLIVIDTKTPYSQMQFDTYHTNVWVTRDTIFTKMSNGEIRAYGLEKIKDLQLSKFSIMNFVSRISPWFTLLVPAGIFLLLLFFYLSYVFTLIPIFFVALIIWLAARFFFTKIPYDQAYTISLYAVTLGLLINCLLALLSFWVRINEFPFMLTVISLGVFAINFGNSKATKVNPVKKTNKR